MSASARGGILDRLRVRENQVFLALTIVISVNAGLAAVLFALAIEGVQGVLFDGSPSAWRLILIPTLVSLLTGVLLVKFFPDARGSGVPQTKAAFHLHEGRIPLAVPIGKFLTGALTVGSGHSMGREGPSVQIGAGLAAAIGRRFGLSPARAKDLIPIGAAAALAAAFNTPMAAVLFALEEIIGDMNASLIGSTVLASVTAVVVERSILGNETLFRVPSYQLAHPAELLAYAALGIVGGGISLLFCKSLLRLRAFFLRLPPASAAFQPAIGGLALGALLVATPQVMGVGYRYIDQALNGGMLPQIMLMLCFAKLAATVISYASGNAGGIFGPSLYLGAMTGGAMGWVVQHWAPFPTGGPGAYALVGMGALFAGIVRAPMTSVVMIFELTQDYQILVPLMVANMISLVVCRQFQPTPIYHALLEQNHVYLPERETARGRLLADVMDKRIEWAAPGESIGAAQAILESEQVDTLFIGNGVQARGFVTRKSIDLAIRHGRSGEPLDRIAVFEFRIAHADDSLESALERFSLDSGLLPVVSRSGRRLEGAVTLESIMRFVQKEPSDTN